MGVMRVEYGFDLLDTRGNDLGPMEGVHPGTGQVVRSAAASVKASAQIEVTVTGQVDSWLDVRVRPWVSVDGDTWPLGVFLPDVPAATMTDLSQTVTVDLLDRTTILDGDGFGATFGVPAGTVVTTAVADIIASTGETPGTIETDTAALLTSIEWEPDATKLQIVNGLLEAGNFFSLWTDGYGTFQVTPYVRPAARPVMAEFVDGEQGVSLAGAYAPEFTREHDIGSVPNRVIAISQAEGEEPALTATASNTDPDSPYSFPNRGFWKTVVEQNVKTTSQAGLQAYAERRLIDASAPQETVTILHPPSRLTINDTVTFTSRLHRIEGLFTVQRQEWPLKFDGLVKSTLRRVVDL